MDYVPIKVRILSYQGNCLYPDFNDLDVVKASGMDWSQYIDSEGSGWMYDKKCGHAEVDDESPEGTWLALLLIPETFAIQAMDMFPDRIMRLTEVETEDFYDNRCAYRFPDEDIDISVMEGIKLKQDLGLELTAMQIKAMDPGDDTPGIRKNKRKKWQDLKVLRNLKIKELVTR